VGKGKNRKRRKAPRYSKGLQPGDRQPRTKENPESHNREKIAWQLRIADLDGPWGWNKLDSSTWWKEIHPKLRDYESMTWGEILSASGGRARGNNSHLVPIEELCKDAQRRLTELKQDDISDLFSLRLKGKARLWGIPDGRVLRVIWYDPEHEVCPSERN